MEEVQGLMFRHSPSLKITFDLGLFLKLGTCLVSISGTDPKMLGKKWIHGFRVFVSYVYLSGA